MPKIIVAYHEVKDSVKFVDGRLSFGNIPASKRSPIKQAQGAITHAMLNEPAGEIVFVSGSKKSCASRIRTKGLESLIIPCQLKDDGKVRFEPKDRFKGLESFCVLATDTNELPCPRPMTPLRELLYTAITRAVFRLDCFASKALEAQLGLMESAM